MLDVYHGYIHATEVSYWLHNKQWELSNIIMALERAYSSKYSDSSIFEEVKSKKRKLKDKFNLILCRTCSKNGHQSAEDCYHNIGHDKGHGHGGNGGHSSSG